MWREAWVELSSCGDYCGDGGRGAFFLAVGMTLIILPASIAALMRSRKTDRRPRLMRGVLLGASAINGLVAAVFLAFAVQTAGNGTSSMTICIFLAVIFILIAAAFSRWTASLS